MISLWPVKLPQTEDLWRLHSQKFLKFSLITKLWKGFILHLLNLKCRQFKITFIPALEHMWLLTGLTLIEVSSLSLKQIQGSKITEIGWARIEAVLLLPQNSPVTCLITSHPLLITDTGSLILGSCLGEIDWRCQTRSLEESNYKIYWKDNQISLGWEELRKAKARV